MGVNHSKVKHKVRKVAPLENKDVYVSPTTTNLGVSGLNSTPSFGTTGLKAPSSECQLPPLRETLYGGGPIVPRPLSFDVPLDNGDTSSIIKKHPPRRLQKLEPAVLPSILAAGRIITKQEAAAAKAELTRSIQREVKINKHKTKEIKAKKVRENAMKCREDEDFLPVEHDETFNVDHGNTWQWNIQEPSTATDCHWGKGKLEMWFQSHHDGSESNYDSSSTDSLDSWLREDAKSRRRPAALFRTRAERIPTFDEFFDCEF
ncbi:hypothetical protein GDO78_010519 [Eleutherodactylus coqui]|uniref:Uncharacterized protein n=1 Tax=Eleutherodactylus coqui TaxID=57060 RepID=A0A8J6F4D8_ELECQ|nr:hypothetical protein GDO78_010519 [Eleutherodactylus coqui]